MNTNPSSVTITNYDAIVEYFKLFPEHLMQNVSNNEQRPISPLDINNPIGIRSAKWN